MTRAVRNIQERDVINGLVNGGARCDRLEAGWGVAKGFSRAGWKARVGWAGWKARFGGAGWRGLAWRGGRCGVAGAGWRGLAWRRGWAGWKARGGGRGLAGWGGGLAGRGGRCGLVGRRAGRGAYVPAVSARMVGRLASVELGRGISSNSWSMVFLKKTCSPSWLRAAS